MRARAADLDQCADEPIRIPGAIQPHGWLLALHAASGAVAAYSENFPQQLGTAPGPATTARLASLLQELAVRTDDLLEGESPAPRGTALLGSKTVDITAHRTGALVVVEFETVERQTGTQAPIYQLARHLLPQLQHSTSVGDLARLAVEQMKRLTGFGRCLLYRFDEHDHGEVLAEALDPGYESYAAHCFPASDIPRQARELYLLNHIRLIPTAHYEPVPIHAVPPYHGPLDLTFASLRSVSPVHLEYMRNMGTLASMSVSIVVRGRLWGLISCHHHEPRHLPFQTRAACEHLGQLVSLQIEAKEDNAEVAARLELRQLTLEIVQHLAESDGSLQRLVTEPAPLLRLARAGGAAVVLDDQCWTVGDTPQPDEVLALASWLAHKDEVHYQTDRLPELFPPAEAYAATATGLLSISISQVHRHLVIWFRPERLRTVRWAGDPRKPMSESDGRLHPRQSFASWQEQVRGRSLPWSFTEVAAVLELRQALIAIVLRRAQEMAEVAAELGRVNKELEAFSYTVSHDLRAPMRHIAGYVDLVVDTEGRQLSERSHRYLSHVKEAAAYAGQLVDALLDFSRMGRSALKPSVVDLQLLVDEIAKELSFQNPQRAIEWQIDPELPALWADPLLLQVAVRNLMGNAVKYTRGREPARIAVRALRRPEGDGLEVADNGVGFEMKYVAKLFGVFQRLHHSEEFEGTGIGLANVRRIVERHGGQVEAEGRIGEGATFRFVVPGRSDKEVR